MKIAILTRGPANYSTKRLIEAGTARGHEMVIFNTAKCYVHIEHNKPQIFYKGQPITGIDAVIPRIGNSITKFGSSIVRQFEVQDVFTTAKSIAITRSRDKLRSLQLLSKYGVDIPKTIFARETADEDTIIEHLGGAPLIIKLARGTHGKGVVLAESRKAAKSVMQAFNSQGLSFLVQDFIEESDGSDVRVLVVGGRTVAYYKRQGAPDEFRSNLHTGGTGVKTKLSEDERKMALKAAKSMGLPIAGVDIVRSKRGPLVIEVNSSPGLRGVEQVTGRDVADKIIEYVERNAKRKPSKDKVGA